MREQGKMASKEIAMMLDELMGRNRNSNPDDKQEELTWQSRGVCPYFLVCQRYWQCTPHTAHCTLHTTHRTPHTAHCTMHTSHGTLHTAQCTLNTAHCTLHN